MELQGGWSVLHKVGIPSPIYTSISGLRMEANVARKGRKQMQIPLLAVAAE
jgi:hypothetical protein